MILSDFHDWSGLTRGMIGRDRLVSGSCCPTMPEACGVFRRWGLIEQRCGLLEMCDTCVFNTAVLRG